VPAEDVNITRPVPPAATGLSSSLESRLALLCRQEGEESTLLISQIHSFIEEYVRELSPELAGIGGFADLLRAFSRRRGVRRNDERETIERLVEEHDVLDRVGSADGHDTEEALAARYNFLRFCGFCRIESPALLDFAKPLLRWDERKAPLAEGGERNRIQDELAETEHGKLLAQSTEWAQKKQRLAELEGEALRLSAERDREHARGETGRERAAALDGELAECQRLKTTLVQQLEAYRDLDSYVRNVNRFSLYTRTRMDYERGVMRLTAEQEQAVADARPGHDFLIRGGAGTGKTIVLLHAFGAAVRARAAELALHSGGSILFLTYTRTLVKYDRYVAEILREAEAGAAILTADGFFQDRLRMLGKQQRIDYGVIGQLAAKLNDTGFFSPQELAVEIEDFIFANMVTRREYIEERIPRRGMRTPLSAGQREAVWHVRDEVVELMEHDGILSRNYSRSVLIDHLASSPGNASLGELDMAFVDESQDLTAADLRALKLMSRRGLIMAGDTGQSIYGVGSPYRRAGMDIAGRTRVLHTSFRNTMPIQEVADAYRALSSAPEEDDGAGAWAFRDGPAPELYTAGTRTELLSLLLRKTALFIDSLGYDPENLTILAPTKTDLATIGDSLGHAGYRYANIRDEEFSFKETATIRLSTLHSSKGLDFAVVLLYLPALPPRGEYEERSAEGIVRNLLYVAMTRAMDNLNVFTLEGAHDGQQEEPLQDLVRVFRQYRQRRISSPGSSRIAAGGRPAARRSVRPASG
jgi:hypothetical protein